MRKTSTYVFLLALSSIVLAENASDDDPDCIKGSARDMAKCREAQFYQLEDQLYKSFESALINIKTTEGKKSLISAQVSWEGYVDAECQFNAKPYRSGTYLMIVNSCKSRLAKLRKNRLDEIARCDENDCP